MAIVQFTIRIEQSFHKKDYGVETDEQMLEKIKEDLIEDPSFVLDYLDRFTIECNLKTEEKEKT